MTERGALVWAAATLIGARLGVTIVPPVLLVLALFAWLALAGRTTALVVATAALAALLSGRADAGLRSGPVGPVSSFVTLLRDPQPDERGVRAVVRLERKRVLLVAHGPPSWRIARLQAGDAIRVTGVARRPAAPLTASMRSRHIAARVSVSAVDGYRRSRGAWLAANKVRDTLLRGARPMGADARGLYAGFVLGDDRDQRPEVAADFRSAGLTHLLVVSGQNVAFVLVLVSPLVKRGPLWCRFGVGVGVVVAFALVTRFEPSVLRASAMAAVAMFGRFLGRPVSSIRALSLATVLLVVIDPFLAWSAGFALSLGACAGIALLQEPLDARLQWAGWAREPLATTIAAQIGTMPMMVGLFGSVPTTGIIANLLAGPAAGPIMTWGLVAGVPAGLAGGVVAAVLHAPTRVLLWWVALVAKKVSSTPLPDLSGLVPVVLCAVLVVGAATRLGTVPRRSTRGVRVAMMITIATALATTLTATVVVGAARTSAAAGEVLGERGSGRLWRSSGWIGTHRATVVVIDRLDVEELLVELRRRRVGRIDVLVVRQGAAGAAGKVAALAERIRVATVLGPPRLALSGPGSPLRADVVRAGTGTRALTGHWLVTVVAAPKSGRRLDVRVETLPP